MSKEYREHIRIKGVFIYQVNAKNKVGVLTGFKTLQLISFHSDDDIYELRLALIIDCLVYPLMRGFSKIYLWDIDKILFQCPFTATDEAIYYVIRLPRMMSDHQKSRLHRILTTSCHVIGNFTYLPKENLNQLLDEYMDQYQINEMEKKMLRNPQAGNRRGSMKYYRRMMNLIDKCNEEFKDEQSFYKHSTKSYIIGPTDSYHIDVSVFERCIKMTTTLYVALKCAYKRLKCRREILERLGIPQEMNANYKDSINDAYYLAAEIYDEAIDNVCISLLAMRLDPIAEQDREMTGAITRYRLMDEHCETFGHIHGLNQIQVMENYKNLNQVSYLYEDCDRVYPKLRPKIPYFDPKYTYLRMPYHIRSMVRNYES